MVRKLRHSGQAGQNVFIEPTSLDDHWHFGIKDSRYDPCERILDLLVLFPLLLAAAVLTFHNRLLDDSTLRFVLASALGLGVLAVAVIVGIWRLGDGLRRMLRPAHHSIFTAFREGAIHSFKANLAGLVGISIAVWICEGGRLFLVLASLGMAKQGEVGPRAPRYSFALGSSVLTTLPLTPGGAGEWSEKYIPDRCVQSAQAGGDWRAGRRARPAGPHDQLSEHSCVRVRSLFGERQRRRERCLRWA